MKEIKNVQPPMRSYHVSPFVVATDDCCCCWSGLFFSKLRNWLSREISSCFLPHCYKAQGSCRQMLPVATATATATRGHIVHRAARETAKNEPLNSRRQLQSARQLCQATTESLLPPPFVSSPVHMWPMHGRLLRSGASAVRAFWLSICNRRGYTPGRCSQVSDQLTLLQQWQPEEIIITTRITCSPGQLPGQAPLRQSNESAKTVLVLVLAFLWPATDRVSYSTQ